MTSRWARACWTISVVGLFCSGCGYRIENAQSGSVRAIAVPFVVGDSDGGLTSALIQAVSQSGRFEYCSVSAPLILQVKIVSQNNTHIGFRYDRKKKGRLRKVIIPTETRITAIAEVALIDAGTQCPVVGPAKLTASVDFDHDYFSSRKAVNILSLGQLNDYDVANDDVHHPLNRVLAQKIVDFISESW